MAIKQGDTLPDATFVEMTADGPAPVQLADKTAGRKIVIFAVPGAFTPTCHLAHVPSFIRTCLLYTSPSPRDKRQSRMPSSA